MIKPLFIFDLDGTLYNVDNKITKLIDKRIEKFIKKEKKFSDLEFEEFEKKVPDLLEALKILKINKDTFYKEVYKNINYKKYFNENGKLKNEIKLLNGKKIVCSNSCEKHVKGVLKSLNILDNIDEIYCTDKFTSKLEIYQYLLKKYNLPVNKIYVIGNDYSVDIKPARTLGLNTIYIKNNSQVNNIEEAIKIIKYEEENFKYE